MKLRFAAYSHRTLHFYYVERAIVSRTDEIANIFKLNIEMKLLDNNFKDNSKIHNSFDPKHETDIARWRFLSVIRVCIKNFAKRAVK